MRLDTSILAADEFAEESITISASNMQGYKSALLWYYKENGIVMDPSTNDWIDTFVKGYKKVVADKKSRGVMKLQEGKSALSFQRFNIMCETICSLTPTGRKFTYQELLFGWAYSTICWNTMGRSHSVAGIMFHHITWKDDCLVITFPKSKCDQTANKVMTALEDIAIEMKLIIQPNDIEEMAQEESDVIFEKAYNKLILLCYGDKCHLRPYDLLCNTSACRIYNSSKKRKREDHDEYDN